MLRQTVPKHALNTEFRGQRLCNIATEVLDIAAAGLKARGIVDSDGKDEADFLDTLKEIAERGFSPAEELAQLFGTKWKKNVDPIYEDFAY